MSETLGIVVGVGVIVAAIALVMQAFSSYATFKAMKALRQEISPLLPQAREVLYTAGVALAESRQQFMDISERVNATLDLTHQQLQHFDAARADFTERARIQIERFELVLDDSLLRLQEVVETVHGGVIRPAREVAGVIAGIRAGWRAFTQGGRPSVDRATHDEEMFI